MAAVKGVEKRLELQRELIKHSHKMDADRSYFYLPAAQILSTKSARMVENLNRPGAVIIPFWGHFGVKVSRLLPLFP